MKLAFAGTPAFAAWVLADLFAAGRRPGLVISQPDRPRGRGRRAASPPVVAEAHRLGLEYLQVDDVNDPAVLERLRAAGVSTLVVAAFGQILGRLLLESFLCLNVHASLLPAYRGAAPIERALAAGETTTGVSIVRMSEGLDEGPMALQTSVSVGLRDDSGSLGRILAALGAVGVDQVLTGVVDGTVSWVEQAGTPTYAAKLRVEDMRFDVARGAKAAHDRVRALSPVIGVRAACGELAFKIWRTWPYGQRGLEPPPEGTAIVVGRPGVVRVSGERLFVGCSEGVVELLLVQPAARGKMPASDFLRGYGDRLGETLESADERQSRHPPAAKPGSMER